MNTSPRAPRFIVTELEGYWGAQDGGGRVNTGLSIQVCDRLVCYRVVWSRRSEDIGNNSDARKDRLRHEALTVAARLNGEPEPEPLHRWRARFRPTCPKCGAKWDKRVAYCPSCHANLYRHEWNGHGAARHD